MFSSIYDRSVCLLFLYGVYCFDLSLANEYKKDGPMDRNARTEDSYRGGMWFGPRLGKRSLHLTSESDRQSFYRMLEAAEALKYYYNKLPYLDMQADEPEARVTKKVIFTPKLGRSADDDDMRNFDNNVNFTPRLGRRLPDSVGVTQPDQDTDRSDPEVNTRTKYFSPRLGRNMNFSPRLGRDIIYDVFPPDARVRVVRSVNKNNTTSSP